MTKSNFSKAALLIFLSCFVSLVLFEIALIVFDQYPPPHPLRPYRPDLYQADEIVGYRLWRSTATTDRYPVDSENVLPIVSNSNGFRSDREFDEADPRMRILVVGDSFVFGNGVRSEQRLTEVLEAMEPSWRVDNLGMTGWGIDLMLRALEHIAPKAKPDVIVVAVYTDDFRRVAPNYSGLGYAIPKYELEDGDLVTRPYPTTTGWRRLRTFQLLKHVYWTRLEDRNRFTLNEMLLNRIAELSERQRSKLVVLFLPGKGDSKGDRKRRRFLRNWSSSRQIPYADLTRPIHDAGVKKTYIAGNWHWNPLGHQIAAEELHELLRTIVVGDEPRRSEGQ